MHLTGALLVILAGGWTGLSAARELHRNTHLVGELLRVTERMYTEICRRRRPLPEVMGVLEEEFPVLFPRDGAFREQLREEPFGALWQRRVRTMALLPAADGILRRLGTDLASGADPERTLSAAQHDLEVLQGALSAREKESSRLYVALGFSVGCLTAILLI